MGQPKLEIRAEDEGMIGSYPEDAQVLFEKPPRLTEVDRLLLRLAVEKTQRLEAQLALVQAQQAGLKAELERSATHRKELEEMIKQRYELGDGDSADLDSGVITRGPVKP